MKRLICSLTLMVAACSVSACSATPPRPVSDCESHRHACCCCHEHAKGHKHRHSRHCPHLHPDELDDFGPRHGHSRVDRCGSWQSLDEYIQHRG